MRRLVSVVAAFTLVAGCAGPSKLAEKSQKKLAAGDHQRAWNLATRALDREPGNPHARAAATASATAIAQDWQRRIQTLAGVDSLAAADQVLEFAAFRLAAARYTAVPVGEEWSGSEQRLRRYGARYHYGQGATSLETHRPKKAYDHFAQVERFVPSYRDAAKLADRAYDHALVRVAFVPFRSSSRDHRLGLEVAAQWRDDLARDLTPPTARFTRILAGEPIEERMTVGQLDGLSRDQAVRIGRKAGAERVVWGSIGPIESDTRLEIFKDTIARRIVEKGADGRSTTRWIEVPIEVVARVREVNVELQHEVIASLSGTVLAHHRGRRSSEARVVWTSFAPEGDLASYELISEPARAANPDQAERIEAKWRSVCGEKATLQQVLEARRSSRGSARYQRESLGRIMAGAAVVFLEDLPPPEDLAFAALAHAWDPLRADLLRLDEIDDVDLAEPVVDEDGR